jgi:aryl-alcohol dehydrogenase-like predicted oxidoreductase
MEQRPFGRTGIFVSALGFGCGAVGGLMVRGEPPDQERAVARAVDSGITFFDTAPGYGDGRSETNLGRVLARLRPEIVLATKVMIRPGERRDIAGAVARSLEASLRRLGRDRVDLLQLHNPISDEERPESIPPGAVLGEVLPAMSRLREAGKVRLLGFTGLGETAAVLRVIDSGALDSVQVAYNLLNPSATVAVSPGFPGQDFGRLLDRARAAGIGSIGIRALAAGALSGSIERHPVGAQDVPPIGTGPDYATDVRRAAAFRPLLAPAGAEDLVELALRFATSAGGPTTVLVGVSSLGQLDHAIASVEKGPLPPPALDALPAIWAGLPA